MNLLRKGTTAGAGDAALSLLALLICGGCAAFLLLLPRDAALLLVAASALGVVVGCWRPNLPVTVALIGVIAVAAGALAFSAGGVGIAPLVASALVVLLLGGAAMAASGVVRGMAAALAEQRGIVEALVQVDAATEALKPVAGLQRLRDEVARATRYRDVFSVLVGTPSDWTLEEERYGLAGARAAYETTLRAISGQLRETDRLALKDERTFFAVLAETPAANGMVMVRRVQEMLRASDLMPMRFSMVQFPDDGRTAEALLDEACEALSIAELANSEVISRQVLAGNGASPRGAR
jgi:hypothetical protein